MTGERISGNATPESGEKMSGHVHIAIGRQELELRIKH